jgi:hypothetical protein
VSSQSVSGTGSKRSLAIILAVVAILALILGILWVTGSAPSFLNSGSHVKGSGHHYARGGVALVVFVVSGVGAWWASKKP